MAEELNFILENIYNALVKKYPDSEFQSAHQFSEWCRKQKYRFGMTLTRIDENKPYGTTNCVLVAQPKKEVVSAQAQLREAADRWERCVGPIRKKYEKEIRAILRQEAIDAECQRFQYEHPDLVREGVVFHG